jgi:hypothetical protein
VTQYITMMVMNLVKPKAGAKHELLFNKPASSLFRWVGLTSKSDLSSTKV